MEYQRHQVDAVVGIFLMYLHRRGYDAFDCPFLNDRELLSCDRCGLLEDVDITGAVFALLLKRLESTLKK